MMATLDLSIATRVIPSEYQRWNDALAERFFPRGQTQPVYLDPDDATLADVAGAAGVAADPVSDFIESVKATLWLQQPGRFLYWHDEWFADWRSRRRGEAPPMVALLALFSYASTRMEDDRGYFGPLSRLLGVANIDAISGAYNRRVRFYWSALNAWIESNGRGTPTAYPQDWRANVSLLLTQRFLSAAERGKLPAFFVNTGLTPGVSLTMSEMREHVRRHEHLLPVELTDEWRRHQDRFAEVSCIELESWTGDSSALEGAPQAPLLLGLYFDRRKETVQFPLAIASTAAPSGEFFFEGASEESELVSHAVSELGGSVTFEPGEGARFARGPRLSSDAIVALLREEAALSSRSGFKLQRPRTSVTLFLPLSANSYLEAPGRSAPLGAPFSLLVPEDIARDPAFAAIVRADSSIDWVGCPSGWRLYRDLEFTSALEAAPDGRHSAEIRRLLPLPHEAVIDLRGGIALAGPTRAGRAWLACRPPEVIVSGAGDDMEVQLHLRPVDGTEAPIELLVEEADRHFARKEGGQVMVAGDHQLFAVRDGRTLTQRKLRAVSSDTPRVELRGVGHGTARAWSAVSADLDAETGTVRGACWAGLESAFQEPASAHPPSSLAPLAHESEDLAGEETALGLVSDVRPDRYRRRTRPRRRPVLQTVDTSSLKTRYEQEIRDAVDRRAEIFQAADGTRWRIRYFDDDEIIVKPEHGFTPLHRFKVTYE
jgi:hypothetical protein